MSTFVRRSLATLFALIILLLFVIINSTFVHSSKQQQSSTTPSYSYYSTTSPSSSSSSLFRVGCVGDSITHGDGSIVVQERRRNKTPARHPKEGNYPRELLQRLLRLIIRRSIDDEVRVEFEVMNFGHRGATVSTTSSKRKRGLSEKYVGVPYNTTLEYKRLLQEEHRPRLDVVVFMLGTNDAKEKVWAFGVFEDHLKALILDIQSVARAPLWLVLIPPPVMRPLGGIRDDLLRDHVTPALRRSEAFFKANQINVKYIDMRQVFERKIKEDGEGDVEQPTEVITTTPPSWRRWLHDGVHPTKAGHALMADVIFEELVKKQQQNNMLLNNE
eukprot:PhM_4_TR12903/c0_g1_i1/m.105973